MENLGVNREFWRGRRVFLTGHTGFKGGWLSLWLSDMGAEVYGYALAPSTRPNFYTVIDLNTRLAGDTISEIRDLSSLTHALESAKPEIVFHLAAQSLVRHSYDDPVETFAVNVMGTVNLLEAARHTRSIKAFVNVTTDKCYDNREWVWPYRENDVLGGNDPYSSSKACSELATVAYRKSFLARAGIHLASARAGNVIGGGDWATDRLVADFFRALTADETLTIRAPDAIRPWQHVVEPLAGYLMLAEKLVCDGEEYAEAWNFGPEEVDAWPVKLIAEYLCDRIPRASWHQDVRLQPPEASTLKLNNSKAKARLGWQPRWALPKALDNTIAWHDALARGDDMVSASLLQIRQYESNVENP